MTDKPKPAANPSFSTAGDSASSAQALRQRAESAFRKKPELSPQRLAALSPEAVRQMLHELQVHQIELEMQNEELRRAQQELDAARERYFDLYDMAPVAYCTVSEPGLVLEANFTAAALLGMTRGVLVGQQLTSCIFKDDQDIYYGLRQQLFASNLPATDHPALCELRLVKSDGKPFWAHLTACVVQDPAGVRVCRMVLHDVSERHAAEAALRTSEQRLRLFLESAPAALAIFDPSMRYLAVSRRWLLDYKLSEDPIGRSHFDVFPNLTEARKVLYRRALAGESFRSVGDRFDSDDGLVWRKWEILPWYAAPGEIGGIMIATEDISEQKRAEERWRFALETSELGAWENKLADHSDWRSPRLFQIFGYDTPPPQWSTDAFLGHVIEEDRAEVARTIQRATAQHEDWTFDCRIRRTDGVVRWICLRSKSVNDADGRSVRRFGVVEDITARKDAEDLRRTRDEEQRVAAQVALASKYKSEFLANMSHELRTPLNSLLILSRLLADNREHNLTAKQVDFAEIMHQSGSDLLRLINDILDLSRIEAGKVEVVIEAVSLARLCIQVERNFRHVAQARYLEFSISLDPQLPALIRSDANRLEQVLKNLLANSFKFTGSGQVRLDIRPATDGWSRPHASLDGADAVIAFSVADSGIGIAPEKHKLIFEAFAQADGSTSRNYGGTGLGLSISRELATLLGGAIALSSEVGVGSTFTLYLPYTSAATGASPYPLAEPTGRQLRPHAPPVAVHSAALDDREAIRPGDDVLLIVECDPVFAGLLLDIAHRHAFKGLVGGTAAAALQLARQFQPMAITLSVTLPDLDGWTLLRRLTDDLGLRHIPVHIVSGEDERPRALRQGAASYLPKPASEAALGELFERIRAANGRVPALLVVEADPAMQRQIVQALGVGADVQTTHVTSADVLTTHLTSADVQTTLVASAEQGLTELKARRYDCVVLDLRLPGMSGYDFLEAVRDELRIDDLPIVVFTGMDLSTQQQARLSRLAESVLVKDARSLDRLLDQTSLYLHRRVHAMPDAARATLERLHIGADMLAGRKVLVVDDDMRNVFALFAILENAGIEARHAENGVQCLAILQASNDFDAVLIDITWPEMDGCETLRRIRTMKGVEALPVIALTAKAKKADREKCIQAGATDCLAKPLDPERLLALLRYWTAS